MAIKHNWFHLIHQTIANAKGKKLDGSDGDWESALYQLIHESYKQELSDEDKAVVCVLITLHDALIGKISLEVLAALCVGFHQVSQQSNPERN